MIQLPLQLPFPVVSDPSEIRLKMIPVYTIGGAAYNYAGYMKSSSKTGEDWSLEKAKRAIVLGFLTGLLVSIMDPEASPTAETFEYWAPMAPVLLDQLKGAWDNVTAQAKNNQYGDWADDWFEDGRRAQRGDLEIDASDEYFDAVAPDDMMAEDNGGDGDSDGDSPDESA